MPLTSNNKQIAKNTLFLYLRMGISLIANFFIVKIVWRALGIEDYGIYNVVAGIVIFFTFLNTSMMASTQRYLNYEMGRNNEINLQHIFSTSILIHIVIAVIVVIFAETIGVWFLNYRLNIPLEKVSTANWVFQCSVLSLFITVISVPYNACVIAHEHMKTYGYFGIAEVLLKLILVLSLFLIKDHRLIVYSLLLLLLQIIMRFAYTLYCRRLFSECRFNLKYNSKLFKEMLSFASWSFLGNFGFAVRDQGITFLINIFFGVAVNAAIGISQQVSGVIMGFMNNFQMALNPQITKNYASGNIKEMMKLVFFGCKYSFYLILITSIPVFIGCDLILSLWIGNTPIYSIEFLRIIILITLIRSIASPLVNAMQATGKIRNYHIIISVIIMSTIPISYIILKLGGNPYSVLIISLITTFLGVLARIVLLYKLIYFNLRKFAYEVLFKNYTLAIICFILPYLYYSSYPHTIFNFIIMSIISIATSFTLIYFCGLNNTERKSLNNIIQKIPFIRNFKRVSSK